VERVVDRLSQIGALVASEQRAFDAFVAVVEEHRQDDAIVLEMFGRRSTDTP
jgi:hypothetical protein